MVSLPVCCALPVRVRLTAQGARLPQQGAHPWATPVTPSRRALARTLVPMKPVACAHTASSSTASTDAETDAADASLVPEREAEAVTRQGGRRCGALAGNQYEHSEFSSKSLHPGRGQGSALSHYTWHCIHRDPLLSPTRFSRGRASSKSMKMGSTPCSRSLDCTMLRTWWTGRVGRQCLSHIRRPRYSHLQHPRGTTCHV